MGNKIHAIFVDKNYKYLFYREFTLGKDIKKAYWNWYRCYDDDKSNYYQTVYEKYWSSWLFDDWKEWYVFVSENAEWLFEEWKCWNVQR